jgi:hypothetical protein
LDNDDDDGIEFVMVAVQKTDKEVSNGYEMLALAAAVLTRDYPNVIVKETLIVEATENVENNEHKKCFETDMVEIALVEIEFRTACACRTTLTCGLGTLPQVYTPHRTSMEWFRKPRPRIMEESLSGTELVIKLQCTETLPEQCAINKVEPLVARSLRTLRTRPE